MAKRFTDTEKWKKKFLRGLDGAYKLLWFFILDDCDHAGIWHVNFDIASVYIGEDIDESRAIEIFKDKVVVFDKGEKWFIPSFIDFQYIKLTENNRAHNSVIIKLKKYNLFKGLTTPLQGDKDKEQDKDMDKEQDKVKNKFGEFKHVLLSKIDYKKLVELYTEEGLKNRIKNLDEYLETTPKKSYKNHCLVIQKWEKNNGQNRNC